MVGSALADVLSRQGHTVLSLSRRKFDVLRDPVARLPLDGVNYAVNAIGLINRRIRDDSASTAEAWMINSIFPRVLADRCEENSVRLIHVSTDCVFDGVSGLHTEDEAASAADLYGRSKALGEPRNCLVLRGSFVGPEHKNHYSLMSWFLAQNGTVHGYANHLWNGITSFEFARAIDAIIRHGLHENGIRHVFGEDTTKLDLLRLFGRALGHPVQVAASNGAPARDTRLRTRFPAFLGKLGIRPLTDQMAELGGLDGSSWSRPAEPAGHLT